jgi:hypothetical protein
MPGQTVTIGVARPPCGSTTSERLIKNVPRTSRKEVRRHKAYGYTTNHNTG